MGVAGVVGAMLGCAGLGFICAYPFALIVRSVSAIRASIGFGADVRD